MSESQSARMEVQLESFRRLFNVAEDNDRPAEMVRLGKTIGDYEKTIHKLKVEEGKLLADKQVLSFVDELSFAVIEAIQNKIEDKKLRDDLIDEIISVLDRDWACQLTSATP